MRIQGEDDARGPLRARAGALCCLLLASLAITGCVSNFVPTLREPDRLYSQDEEISYIKSQIDPETESVRVVSADTKADRNKFITLRMYAIDLAYSKYEAQLTHETEEAGLGATLINLGLTGAASVIPAGETTKALSAAATGVTGAAAAYDKDILLSQSIQNLETQMRADRNNQAAVIFANMKCSVAQYTVGQALSDIEVYRRAGTLTNALIGISKTVGNAEVAAKANKDTQNASQTVAAAGISQLNASANVVATPANAGVGSGCS